MPEPQLEIVDIPGALFGMAGERAVVEREPGLCVALYIECPDAHICALWPRRGQLRSIERVLQQKPLGRKAETLRKMARLRQIAVRPQLQAIGEATFVERDDGGQQLASEPAIAMRRMHDHLGSHLAAVARAEDFAVRGSDDSAVVLEEQGYEAVVAPDQAQPFVLTKRSHTVSSVGSVCERVDGALQIGCESPDCGEMQSWVAHKSIFEYKPADEMAHVRDSVQKTTAGLAFYRQSTNTASFTNGTDHWALLARGLAHRSGAVINALTLG